jgi:hypothetical protein
LPIYRQKSPQFVAFLPVDSADHSFWPQKTVVQLPGTYYAEIRMAANIREAIMIVRRRTWFYRLAGQRFAHAITFRNPLTAPRVKEVLRQTVGMPVELWGRSA